MESKILFCKCTFLDGKDIDVSVERDALGYDLFNSVCNYLNIKNRNMFGLVHKSGSYNPTYRWWVRMDKMLRKQVTGKCKVWAFALVIKFYPTDNFEACEDIARYYLALQVRDDLLANRISCCPNTLAILVAYWAQSELGEYRGDAIDRQLMEGFKFVQADTKVADYETELEFEEEMIEIHRSLKQMTAADADIKFLHLVSSLPMYGCHFYPAFEVANDADHKSKSSRQVRRGKAVTVALGRNGFYVRYDKQHSPKMYSWEDIYSVVYKKNFVTVKLNSVPQNRSTNRLVFGLEDGFQAKVVWRVAVDTHVHFRVEANRVGSRNIALKLSKEYVIFGKKKVNFANSPVVRRSANTAIHPSTPGSIRKSHISLHRSEGDKHSIKEGHDEAATKLTASAKSTPALSHRKNRSPATDNEEVLTGIPKSLPKKTSTEETPVGTPKTQRSKPNNETPVRTPKSQHEKSDIKLYTPETIPKKVREAKVASAIPARLRPKETHSEMSEDGHMSDMSDNTDVLCSKNIIEKAFSYHEKDGINSISSWLELCSRDTASDRGRPASRTTPCRRRYSSMRRPSPEDMYDIDDYKPLIKSKYPVKIDSRERGNPNPDLPVRYDGELNLYPARRHRQEFGDESDQSPYFRHIKPIRLTDRTMRREIRNYPNSSLPNKSDSQRRARSMYSLAPTTRDRSSSPEHRIRRSYSPSAASAYADIGSRYSPSRATQDIVKSSPASELPYASDYTKRVVSESRLANSSSEAIRRFRLEDDLLDDDLATSAVYTSNYKSPYQRMDNDEDLRTHARLNRNAIPSMPKFVRSVR